MSLLKKIIALFSLLLLVTISYAQDKKVEMADLMRENGRIYVVIAVLLTILAGLLLYIIRIDKKLTKLEKEG